MLNRADRRAIKFGRAFSPSRYVYQAYHHDMDRLDFKGDYSEGAGVAFEIDNAWDEEMEAHEKVRSLLLSATADELEARGRMITKGGMNFDRALDHFEDLA